MSKFVRSSKYRHVFGQPAKTDKTFNGVKASKSAWDSNKVAANTKYIAVIWDAAGGGSFAVLGHDKVGKLSAATIPLCAGHKAEVLDVNFHPFNEQLVASASEDGYIKIWQIPEGGFTATATEAVQTLSGHKRKVGTVDFHPTANHVIASTAGDNDVRIWDSEKGDTIVTVSGHTDIIQSAAWSPSGALFATSSKDKKTRTFDPRNAQFNVIEAHEGVKGSRVMWLTDTEICTVGFSKTSERQYKLWDIRNTDKEFHGENIDTASGLLMPFFDADTSLLFMGGKGDGNIRYYEYVAEEKKAYFLTQYSSNIPQRGLAVLPKRAVNVSECEIMRFFKIHGDGKMVEPISFLVPRKSDIFQDDLYPDCYAGIPSMSAAEYKAGENKAPITQPMAPGFKAPERPKEEFKPIVKVEEGPKNEKELRAEYERLKNRVAYLETELAKRDVRIAELENK
jgi:hypothetical protein